MNKRNFIVRLVVVPFVFGLLFVGYSIGLFKHVFRFLKYGGEMVTYSENEPQITLTKIYENVRTGNHEQSLMESELKRLEWSLRVFSEATPKSSLIKAESEIMEIREDIDNGVKNAEEYADAIMCLFDSAGRYGINFLDIERAYAKKVEVNTNRKWIKNSDNTYSHVKE